MNGDDPDFKGQAQHWADDSSSYSRNPDPDVPLPSCSWPPNFYLASPDQQRYIVVEKVSSSACTVLSKSTSLPKTYVPMRFCAHIPSMNAHIVEVSCQLDCSFLSQSTYFISSKCFEHFLLFNMHGSDGWIWLSAASAWRSDLARPPAAQVAHPRRLADAAAQANEEPSQGFLEEKSYGGYVNMLS